MSCTYPAHHELESVIVVIITITIIIIIIITIIITIIFIIISSCVRLAFSRYSIRNR